MKFYLKVKGIYMEGSAVGRDGLPLPLLRDSQAHKEVLQYIVDALNEKWERDPHPLELQTRPEPPEGGGVKPLGRGEEPYELHDSGPLPYRPDLLFFNTDGTLKGKA